MPGNSRWTSEEVAILARNPTGRLRDVRRKLVAAGFAREDEAIRMMRKRLAAKDTKPSDYPEGHFTAVVRAKSKLYPTGWPPHFESGWSRPKGYHSSALLQQYATANKEAGLGHAGAPLNLPGATKIKPNAWQKS